MEHFTAHQEELIEANLREYGYHYDILEFPTPQESRKAAAERDQLLAWLADHALVGYRGTKVDCRRLSPGCQACGAGTWSCLFVNGLCNASCAYCPSPQDEIGVPVTNGLAFSSADDYATYVATFGFTGASISGGEPLLTPERTLEYLAAVRQRCGDSIHLWLYTNGTLLTVDLCLRLRDAGLDEIRFDIGAIRYHLKKVRLAVGIIPTVTVEIPAMPEEEPLLRDKLVELAEAGVNHLNLHQLRLTPHNLQYLASRGYTFLHGEKVTVLESELAALRLVRHSLEQGIGLPVNYCSFPYKRRFQHAAARKRAAAALCQGWESVTEPGFLRTIALVGDPTVIEKAVTALRGAGADPAHWHREGHDRLLLPLDFASNLRLQNLALSIGHDEAAVLPAPSGRGPFRKVPLPSGRSLYLERQPAAPLVTIPSESANAYLRSLNGEGVDFPAGVLPFERIPSGLADYF